MHKAPKLWCVLMHDDCRSSRRRQMAQCQNHLLSSGIERVACYDVALLDCSDFFSSHCKANHQMTSIRWKVCTARWPRIWGRDGCRDCYKKGRTLRVSGCCCSYSASASTASSTFKASSLKHIEASQLIRYPTLNNLYIPQKHRFQLRTAASA